MKSLNPYFIFKGNAEEAFNFYKSVFGGDFSGLQRYGDSPDAGKVSGDERKKIIHIALPVGKGDTLMASDEIGEERNKLVMGNNVYMLVDAESREEADRLFKELSAGGKVQLPMEKTYWNAYYGMCIDKFGVQWMINYDLRQNM